MSDRKTIFLGSIGDGQYTDNLLNTNEKQIIASICEKNENLSKDGRQLEILTKIVYEHKGGIESTLTPQSSDGGGDVLIALKGPLDATYTDHVIECKKMDSVGPRFIRELNGSKFVSREGRSGSLVTSGNFTKAANDEAVELGINLINGEKFAYAIFETIIWRDYLNLSFKEFQKLYDKEYVEPEDDWDDTGVPKEVIENHEISKKTDIFEGNRAQRLSWVLVKNRNQPMDYKSIHAEGVEMGLIDDEGDNSIIQTGTRIASDVKKGSNADYERVQTGFYKLKDSVYQNLIALKEQFESEGFKSKPGLQTDSNSEFMNDFISVFNMEGEKTHYVTNVRRKMIKYFPKYKTWNGKDFQKALKNSGFEIFKHREPSGILSVKVRNA